MDLIARWELRTMWTCEKCHCGPKAAPKNEALVIHLKGIPHGICRPCLKNDVEANWFEMDDNGELPEPMLGGILMELFSEGM